MIPTMYIKLYQVDSTHLKSNKGRQLITRNILKYDHTFYVTIRAYVGFSKPHSSVCIHKDCKICKLVDLGSMFGSIKVFSSLFSFSVKLNIY